MAIFRFATALGAAVLVIAACGQGVSTLSDITSGDLLETALNTITKQELTDDLAVLASDEYKGRGTGYEGDELAATYIENKFSEYGIVPGYGDSYRQKFSVNRGRGHTWNIVGYLPGTDPELKDEVIVIGAHYDHLGQSGSRIYNGADDNGSGTVAVMQVAEAFASIKDSIKRTIVFIAFSAEEIGLVGSTYYTRNPLFSLDKTIYMVNLDMVGWLRDGKLKFLGGGSSDYMSNLISSIGEDYPDVNPYITSSAGGGSDHLPFIRKDVPAVFLHTGSTPVYHKPSDEIDRINYDGLTDATKFAFEIVWELSEKSDERVDWIAPLETPEWNLDHGVTPFIQ